MQLFPTGPSTLDVASLESGCGYSSASASERLWPRGSSENIGRGFSQSTHCPSPIARLRVPHILEGFFNHTFNGFIIILFFFNAYAMDYIVCKSIIEHFFLGTQIQEI